MINDSLSARKEFEKNGFVVYKKIFTESFVYNLINEIYKSSNSINYYDNNNKLRRIEKLYDKGQYLIDANKKILELIKSISSNNFLIFKDKFNAKPPGGEGFFAHYDGVFKFKDEKDVLRNGWYEYGNYFLNALIALDKCNGENGSIELAKAHKGNFNELLKNTKNDGTPALSEEVELKTSFKIINLNVGDIVFFSHTCPHRSKKNNTDRDRRILYYTYSLEKNGSKYNDYLEINKKVKILSKH